MLDLDNTLIDRDGAFRRWAESFVTSCRGTVSDVAWVADADRDGYEARERLADFSGQRFGVRDTVAVVEDLRRGMVDRIELDLRSSSRWTAPVGPAGRWWLSPTGL
jgi:putative hydrolase of the HAD superfamily